MPGSARNGLPERRNYVYRGTGADTLTAHLDLRAADPASYEAPEPYVHEAAECAAVLWTGEKCRRRPRHPGLCTPVPPTSQQIRRMK